MDRMGESRWKPACKVCALQHCMTMALPRRSEKPDQFIEAHGGTLSGENCDDGGACFTVRLPEAKEDEKAV